ncbi:hypothetical protein GCM10009760_04240 [Kitasatospora kazusensis]|uniref:Uncharacterized protein n=1 Tax=Kitasatospora kazusensis TaxID=407974 RepID=A0ABN2YQM3_9ACTN
MSLAALLIFILALVTYLLVRSGELRTWQVALVGLLGIYLDRVHYTDPIIYAVTWLAEGLTHTH